MSAASDYCYIGADKDVEALLSMSMERAATFLKTPGLFALPIKAKNERLRNAFQRAICERGIPLLMMVLRKKVRVFHMLEGKRILTVCIVLEEDTAARECLREVMRQMADNTHETVVDITKPETVEKVLTTCAAL